MTWPVFYQDTKWKFDNIRKSEIGRKTEKLHGYFSLSMFVVKMDDSCKENSGGNHRGAMGLDDACVTKLIVDNPNMVFMPENYQGY